MILAEKVVVVTGSTRGIGFEFAKACAREGAAVVVNSRSQEAVDRALEQLRALWHGHRIAVTMIDPAPPPGVDTPEDLERTRRYYAQAIR